MINTETLQLLQSMNVRLSVVPTTTSDGPALDITMEHGYGPNRCQWVGRAMDPELVDRCIMRGVPTLKQRMRMFKRMPEDTVG